MLQFTCRNSAPRSAASARKQHGKRQRRERKYPAMGIDPKLRAARDRAIVEAAVRAAIAGYGIVQIVAAVGWNRLIGLLTTVSSAREQAIEQAWNDARAQYGLHRRESDPELATAMLRGPVDRFGSDFGLKNFSERFGLALHARAAPVELRGVERREMHHRQMHSASIVNQLGAQ